MSEKNMPPYQSNGASAVDTFHEERIQRLENSTQEISKQVAEYGVQFKYLSQQMDDMGCRITEKLDATIGTIQNHVDAFSKMSNRVEKLEKDADRRDKIWATFYKVAMAVVLAGAGALGAKLVGMFVK